MTRMIWVSPTIGLVDVAILLTPNPWDVDAHDVMPLWKKNIFKMLKFAI